MLNSFIRPSLQITVFTLGLIFLFFISWVLGIIIITTFYIVLLFLRKKKILIPEQAKERVGVITSPVYGEVKSVEKGVNDEFFGQSLTAVEVAVPLTSEGGIRLPFNSEVVDNRHQKQKLLFRYSARNFKNNLNDRDLGGHLITFKGPQGAFLGTRILRCLFGSKPRIWVKAGDRGKMGSLLGHFPFGGLIYLYFLENQKILVKPGDLLRSGETPLAVEK